jgi:Tfp pilus assembly protein PilF
MAYINLKQYEAAISDLNRAIEIDPNYSSAYNNRGRYYQEIGEFEKASADFEKATQINQKN